MIWQCNVVRVVDGDTVRARLRHVSPVTPGFTQTVESAAPAGLALRLVTVDTPERGEVGWSDARGDLLCWCDAGPVEVETYYPDNFGRLLADLYRAGDRGDTASQFLLRAGWEPYT